MRPVDFKTLLTIRFDAIRLALLACILAAGFALPAAATPMTFSINKYVGTGTAGPGPYGTVTLTQNGLNVDVDLTLNSSCCAFVKTGAGDALLFNLDKSSITLGSDSGFVLNTTDFKLVGGSGTPTTASAGTIHSGGGGDFSFAISCLGCRHGGSGVLPGPLDFTVTGVTISDFIANTKGNFFATDICDGFSGTRCSGTPGITGLAIADGPNNPPPRRVPEPITLTLFGAGLAGAFAVRRRKAKTA